MRYVARFPMIVAALAMMATLVITSVDARPGGGNSSGSRGARTQSAPAPTSTAPTPQSTINRSVTQPQRPAQPGAQAPAAAQQRPGGLFGGLGGGLLGGLAAGFIGAGLFGLLSGSGLFSGLGSLSGFLGLLLQVGLIFIVVKLVMGMLRNRRMAAAGGPDMRSALGGNAGGQGPGSGQGYGAGLGAAAAARPQAMGPSDQLGLTKEDFDNFERLLTEIQLAYGREDVGALRPRTTPEMSAYFEQDIGNNEQKGVRNTIADVKLLQGDLSEAWREGTVEYATVAMRFSLVDQMVDRRSGHLVGGQAAPTEATELWTFRRDQQDGMRWVLSAIQQG